jgi:hypoxanthine phosphoribosyltransferase
VTIEGMGNGLCVAGVRLAIDRPRRHVLLLVGRLDSVALVYAGTMLAPPLTKIGSYIIRTSNERQRCRVVQSADAKFELGSDCSLVASCLVVDEPADTSTTLEHCANEWVQCRVHRSAPKE